MVVSADLRRTREAIVREHMKSENRHDFDATLATFDHPRYELIATAEVYDGPDEVSRYFEETRAAFPDQHNEPIAIHHADDAVLVEAWVRGTHLGSYRGLPATGRHWEMQILSVFMFEGERLMCERVYFDANTIREQLGIVHDPDSLTGRLSTVFNHPITIGQAVVRRLTRR